MNETTSAFKHTHSKTGTDLFLNKRVTESTKTGKVTTMFYFSRLVKDEANAVTAIPDGHEVVESGPMAILRKTPAPAVSGETANN